MNHLEEAKCNAVYLNAEHEVAERAIAHALIAIAEQLEIMNTSRAEILRKGYKMGKEAKK